MTKLLVFTLTLLFFSCSDPINKINLDKDAIDVYNLALEKTIGSDTTWRYHLKIPPPFLFQPSQIYKVDRDEHLRLLKWRDSIKSVLDTAELFVIINRKIDTLSSSDIKRISETLNSENNLQHKMKGDTSFNATLLILKNKNTLFDSIKIKDFTTKFNFKIYSDKNFPDDKLRKIGSISFSRVAFNLAKNRAVVYTSFICGGLCGSGQILFFEKLNGKWEYLKTWEMWVS